MGGPAGNQTTASGDVSSNPASLAREKARPEQYRRLKEYADRTRKGLPAIDPLVWWGAGERMQLKRLDLMRDKNGRLVDRETKK